MFGASKLWVYTYNRVRACGAQANASVRWYTLLFPFVGVLPPAGTKECDFIAPSPEIGYNSTTY